MQICIQVDYGNIVGLFTVHFQLFATKLELILQSLVEKSVIFSLYNKYDVTRDTGDKELIFQFLGSV